MKDSDVITGSEGIDPVGSTTSSVLDGARRQEPGAWERVSALYGPLVYGWARRAGLRAEDAADVVQEVFRSVVKHLDHFHREQPGDSFRGWLWTITQNKVRDLRRRGAGPVAVGGTDAQQLLLQVPEPPLSGSGDEAARGETLLTRALGRIRSQFEEHSWRAFWAVVVEGQSPSDVANALGISVNAVYIARSRILRCLRDELGEPGP